MLQADEVCAWSLLREGTWSETRIPRLRTYIIISGVLFALIAVAHVARVVLEGPHLLRQPVFDVATALAIGVALWAFRVLRR